DRVEKLWLSDDQGHESYFLDENNLDLFAFGYLEAFRTASGISCEVCPALRRCQGFAGKGELILARFNSDTLKRLYRGVPTGKGKLGYFVRALKGVLSDLVNGVPPAEAMEAFGKVDSSVEAGIPALARVAIWYGPPVLDSSTVKLPAAWYQ